MISFNFLKKKPKDADSADTPSSDSLDIQPIKVRSSESSSDIPTKKTNLPRNVTSAKTSSDAGGATMQARREDGVGENISARRGGGQVRGDGRVRGDSQAGNGGRVSARRRNDGQVGNEHRVSRDGRKMDGGQVRGENRVSSGRVRGDSQAGNGGRVSVRRGSEISKHTGEGNRTPEKIVRQSGTYGNEKDISKGVRIPERIEKQSATPPVIEGARVLEEEIVGPAPPKREAREDSVLPAVNTTHEKGLEKEVQKRAEDVRGEKKLGEKLESVGSERSLEKEVQKGVEGVGNEKSLRKEIESVEKDSSHSTKNNVGVTGDSTRRDKMAVQDSKKDTSVPHTESNTQGNKPSVEASKTPIPVLKTFHYDAQKLAKEGGGGPGLREILAKELEERRQAEREYRTKTKDLLKDAAILREKQKNFVKRESVSLSQEELGDAADAIAGAVDYIKHGTYKAEKKPDLKVTPDKAIDEVVVEKRPNKEPTQKISSVIPPGGLLKKTPKIFSTAEKENLQQKESEIVEREGIRKAWEDFEIKKQNLESRGASIRDTRPYGKVATTHKNFLRQNVISTLIVLVLLSGISLIIYSILTRPDGEEVPIVTTSTLYTTEDIITAGGSIPVDVSTDTIEWEEVLRENKTAAINKFIPYRIEGVDTIQVSFAELVQFRNISLPQKLLQSLEDYYFIGGYSTKSQDYRILVLSVKNYSELVVLLLNWERNLISVLANLFPDELVSTTNPSRIIQQTAVIDNKNVKILTDPDNRINDVVYYFFNRDYLVIIVGDTEGVTRINDEIRNSNL